MSETLMTDNATTTTEGADASQTADTSATGADQSVSNDSQQTGEQGAGGQQAESGKSEEQQGAPEKYEFVAPEGREFDSAVIDAYTEVAKELNLSQEAAQKVLDKVSPVIAARQLEQLEAAKTDWAKASQDDQEFGGDKLDENLAVARKAREDFGTPELRALLDQSGFGNHPEVIRFFYRVGKATSEDGFVHGGGGSPNPADARRLYSASNMNP